MIVLLKIVGIVKLVVGPLLVWMVMGRTRMIRRLRPVQRMEGAVPRDLEHLSLSPSLSLSLSIALCFAPSLSLCFISLFHFRCISLNRNVFSISPSLPLAPSLSPSLSLSFPLSASPLQDNVAASDRCPRSCQLKPVAPHVKIRLVVSIVRMCSKGGRKTESSLVQNGSRSHWVANRE